MTLTFVEIFVPQDFTIRATPGFMGPAKTCGHFSLFKYKSCLITEAFHFGARLVLESLQQRSPPLGSGQCCAILCSELYFILVKSSVV